MAGAVLFAWVLTVLVGSGADSASGRLGGDYPAFYAAGEIVSTGDWERLYSPERQAEAQAALFPANDDAVLYFAYPPYVASMYRPFAAIDYRLSYALHTVVMAVGVLGALWLLRPVIGGVLDKHFEALAIGSLLFFPLFRAVTGGQNTALTLLLVAGTWRSLWVKNELSAGVCAGLLLYKPQFAVPLLLLLLLRGHWRAAAAGTATAGILWATGAAVMGTGWLSIWWAEVADFAAADADINGHNAISWLGFAEGAFGAGSTPAYVAAGPLMAATAVGLAWLWFSNKLELNQLMALTISGLVLLSPHAMYYDGGILVVAAFVAWNVVGTKAVVPLAALWCLAWTQAGASALGFAPLFALIVGAAVVATPALLRPAAP